MGHLQIVTIKIVVMSALLCLVSSSFGQERRFSEVTVHVWGEVKDPGEYRVPDGTDVMGIISKAGGPTEFSRLSKVRLTRTLNDIVAPKQLALLNNEYSNLVSQGITIQNKDGKRVFELNIDTYLKQDNRTLSLPVLQSGDIVYVPRNRWSAWRNIASIIRDIAIVANAYYWFQRSNN